MQVHIIKQKIVQATHNHKLNLILNKLSSIITGIQVFMNIMLNQII